MKVNIALAKQATKMMYDRLEEIHQSLSLQKLASHQVICSVGNNEDLRWLPLPKVIINYLRYGEFEIGGSLAYDEEFNDIAKLIPGLLWQHSGAKVI